MKKISSYLAMMLLATLPLAFTSCDDDPWNGYDNSNWYDEYDSYSWNNNYNNEYDSHNNSLLAEAQMLCGEWQGGMKYQYTASDGTRQTAQFDADMMFYQYGTSNNSLSGNGVEIDKNGDQSQTLKFVWYIDEKTMDIYIKYADSKNVYVMDANSSNYGFHLGVENGKNVDTFWGYMIGTNTDDVIYIDLERVNASNAKAMTRSAEAMKAESSFGIGKGLNIIPDGERKLIKR
jgi:hypothetical protein